MNAIIESKLEQVAELCRRFRVRRLDVVGSVPSDGFDPGRSDIDFVVEMEEMEPADYADSWMSLYQALEDLFDRSIDLVTYRSMKNPYFKEAVDTTRVQVFPATAEPR